MDGPGGAHEGRARASGAAGRASLAILAAQAELRDDSELVFHGHHHGTPMSLTAVLRRMGRGEVARQRVPRSSFGDWVADGGRYPADIAEAALAHTIGDKTVAAYHRTDLFDPRRKLMADWAADLSRPPAEVVALRVG